jgi:hypothetical protein
VEHNAVRDGAPGHPAGFRDEWVREEAHLVLRRAVVHQLGTAASDAWAGVRRAAAADECRLELPDADAGKLAGRAPDALALDAGERRLRLSGPSDAEPAAAPYKRAADQSGARSCGALAVAALRPRAVTAVSAESRPEVLGAEQQPKEPAEPSLPWSSAEQRLQEQRLAAARPPRASQLEAQEASGVVAPVPEDAVAEQSIWVAAGAGPRALPLSAVRQAQPEPTPPEPLASSQLLAAVPRDVAAEPRAPLVAC